jgi:prenyl protein peptidase
MFLGGDLPFQQHWDCEREGAKFTSWIGIRSYIFAPFTEELVFRACVCTVYHISGTSTSRMIFLTPFTFGVGMFVSLREIAQASVLMCS